MTKYHDNLDDLAILVYNMNHSDHKYKKNQESAIHGMNLCLNSANPTNFV